MRKPVTWRSLENLGRVRLSENFFMRDFLFSEVAAMHGFSNVPEDPDVAIAAGRGLCETLLEPLQETFGRIAVRSSYRSPQVNRFGNENGMNCARNEANYGHHIWDRRDADGRLGATASIVIPWFADRYAAGADWRGLAWYIHDHLPYHSQWFFPKLAALNLQWREEPEGRIDSYIRPRGCLTKPGMGNHSGRHEEWYQDFPAFKG
ncbi:MAG: hypothetical protein JJ878_21295 [Alphaproteobacteria bacterium]|nr:hypothetical protein [Alphaproteobacteria bacterium]MBO6865171.1 hypothetical protein [Alphaproteobacteria bacterium]